MPDLLADAALNRADANGRLGRRRRTARPRPPLVFERRGSGPPLVLLHGFGHHWQAWLPVMDELAESRDVIAVDLPGFGANPPWPARKPMSVVSLGRAIEKFLDSLELERPHVAGNSLGGILALELARRGRARSATLLSPAAFMTTPDRLYVAGLLGTMQALTKVMPMSVLRQVVRVRPLTDGILLAAVAHPSRLSDEAILGFLASIRQAPMLPWLAAGLWYDFRGLGDLDVPITVAWGTRDIILWPRQVRVARAKLPSARLVPLPGCGHLPMSDAPELVARVLLDGSSELPVNQRR